MTAYYNEFDPKAAAWLRELIAEGLIAPGIVDERSITDVRPEDLDGFTQCHWFAGVGGWSIAARLARWPDDRPMWSVSCPCQPFSVAGKGAGAADARHLWPDFFRLVRARRPAFIVGEQVAAAVGKDWFLGVRSDLEGIGYVGRGVVVPACAVNAPHRRDRLWFVAGSATVGDTLRPGLEKRECISGVRRGEGGAPQGQDFADAGALDGGLLEHAASIGRGEGWAESELRSGWPATAGACVPDRDVPDAERERVRGSGCAAPDGAPGAVQGIDGQREWLRADAGAVCVSGVGDVADSDSGGRPARIDHQTAGHGHSLAAASRAGAWDSARWLISHDGKARRVEPSLCLLVDGLPNRAPLLRGYGNAIVPSLAAEVIGAWMDCEGDVS